MATPHVYSIDLDIHSTAASKQALKTLEDAFKTSKGIIDYIGDYRYSGEQPNTYTDNDIETLAAKAEDESINTNKG